jgi:hypothetical protein
MVAHLSGPIVSPVAQRALLVVHPDTACDSVWGVAVEAQLIPPAGLTGGASIGAAATLAAVSSPSGPPVPAGASLNGASLVCRFALHGDLSHVRVPGVRAGRRADGLWRHTCFEAFIAANHVPGYFEFNFSPALDWAAYRFEDYRSGMSVATLSQAPGLQVRRTTGRLELTATVHLAGLASLVGARALRLALAAVVEENDGRLSYWALQHPPGKPDFHHADGFALELRTA